MASTPVAALMAADNRLVSRWRACVPWTSSGFPA